MKKKKKIGESDRYIARRKQFSQGDHLKTFVLVPLSQFQGSRVKCSLIVAAFHLS